MRSTRGETCKYKSVIAESECTMIFDSMRIPLVVIQGSRYARYSDQYSPS